MQLLLLTDQTVSANEKDTRTKNVDYLPLGYVLVSFFHMYDDIKWMSFVLRIRKRVIFVCP